jgi:broad specificity phosphatase PhoE
MSETQVFFFARHGETDWNAAGRWQGQTDVPLNDVGRAQARALGLRLRELPELRDPEKGIRAILSSDLSRACETAEIVARGLGLGLAAVPTDAAFRERAYGIFEGLTREECVARYPAEWALFERDPHATPPGVESLAMLAARMLTGLRRVSEAGVHPALIVSHGRAIRTLAGVIASEPTTPLVNGGVYRVVVEKGEPVSATSLG